MLKKLLVAIDGTEYSWRALEYAIGIAKMAESELVVLTVYAAAAAGRRTGR